MEVLGYVKVLVENLTLWKDKDLNKSNVVVHKGEVFTVIEKVKTHGVMIYKIKSGYYISSNAKYVSFKPLEKTETKELLGTFNISAYCPCVKCCGEHADGKTADLTVIKDYKGLPIVALPKEYPFGTIIEIEGLGRFECHDRGSAITKGRIDILFKTHEEALKFGRRYLKVYIIKK